MNPLEEATVEELVNELARRFPSLIVAGVRPWPGESGTKDEENLTVWRGGHTTAIGLAERMRHLLVRNAEENVISDEE